MALAKRDSSDAKPDQLLYLNKTDQHYDALPKDRPVLVQNHFLGHGSSNAFQGNSIFDQRFSYLGGSNGNFGAPLCIQNVFHADYVPTTSTPSTAIEYVPNLDNAVNGTKETAPIPKNPGFCSRAFRCRQTQDCAEQIRLSASKCSKCTRSIKQGKKRPYPRFYREYLSQRLLFESHLSAEKRKDGKVPEMKFGCWVCWETWETWHRPMSRKEWLEHNESHYQDGIRMCIRSDGSLNARNDCTDVNCIKIHS